MLQPKKINKVSPKPEEKTMKDSPRIVSKLTRYEKFVPNEKAPEKMKTRPASPVPSKDLPSKLNAAVQKAKQFGRTISSVSKEFDGKEVQGKRIESRGGKKVKEVYSMPGGGKRVEKERYNQSGDIMSRKIKDTKINPR